MTFLKQAQNSNDKEVDTKAGECGQGKGRGRPGGRDLSRVLNRLCQSTLIKDICLGVSVCPNPSS